MNCAKFPRKEAPSKRLNDAEQLEWARNYCTNRAVLGMQSSHTLTGFSLGAPLPSAPAEMQKRRLVFVKACFRAEVILIALATNIFEDWY